MRTHYHQLADGRRLAWSQFGDPSGHPLIFAHGGPGSRLEGLFFAGEAARFGFRFICTDRPGMGRSDYQNGRKVSDYAKDIGSLADELGLDRFAVMGWSGGGPPTLAAACLLADRVSLAVSLAGFAPIDFPGALEMLDKADSTAINLAHKSPWLYRTFFKAFGAFEKYMPHSYLAAALKSVGPADREILEDPTVQAIFIADSQEAVFQGSRGLATDAAIEYELDWGFKIADIPGPVHIFQGDQDNMVPLGLSRHAAETIPGGVLHLLPGKGHFFPVDHAEEIFRLTRETLDQTA